MQKVPIRLDNTWGLDHGTWSILNKMYPAADIPVVQLSLDYSQPPEYHYALGKELAALRSKGVLILGSGNIVHNLRAIRWQGGEYDWAKEFDETIRQLIVDGNHDAIVQYQKLGKAALLSVPTNEHYLPLLYILALQQPQDALRFFADDISMGSLSMRSVWLG